MRSPMTVPSLTHPCVGKRSVGAGSRRDPGPCSLGLAPNEGYGRSTNVVIPEKIRMATSVQVAVIPIPEENDKNRKGTKLVGRTLSSIPSLPHNMPKRDSHSKTHEFPLIARELWEDSIHGVRVQHDQCNTCISSIAVRQMSDSHPSTDLHQEQDGNPFLTRWSECVANNVREIPHPPILLDQSQKDLEPVRQLVSDTAELPLRP
jgi:hypothetical protein